MGKVRVKIPPERLLELEEGQVVGLRVLARRNGRWKVLERPNLIKARGRGGAIKPIPFRDGIHGLPHVRPRRIRQMC